ncbi:MAG: hypothetical protein U5K74_05335 [Gemmatimonadaceae bacterium]|nr:hypothetical protein [Gemmatimonadaceae bacterium]
MAGGMDDPQEPAAGVPAGVGDLAALYLGNILYALEVTALGLDAEAKPDDAAFYRGIGRALADAHGREKGQTAR